MASKLALCDTGYEYKGLEQIIANALTCSMCLCLVNNPLICGQKRHMYCNSCVKSLPPHSTRCPDCTEPEALTAGTFIKAPLTITNILSEFFSSREVRKIFIAGGDKMNTILNSAEMLSRLDDDWEWTRLQPMTKRRSDASSAFYDNQFIVMGGITTSGTTTSMEKLNTDPCWFTPWKNVPAELPERLAGHCSVAHNQRLIVIGGYAYHEEEPAFSDRITEISLSPPYTNQLLATMPQRRSYHGVAVFGNKILILGGRSGLTAGSILKSVVMYDITTNECQELAPLPYPVYEMATVKWKTCNVIIMGGVDRNMQPLKKVLIYNINTQKIHRLPDMRYRRRGCVAAVVRGNVIVMGGNGYYENCLKTVEKFTFESFSWRSLPEMHEERHCATAIVS